MSNLPSTSSDASCSLLPGKARYKSIFFFTFKSLINKFDMGYSQPLKYECYAGQIASIAEKNWMANFI